MTRVPVRLHLVHSRVRDTFCQQNTDGSYAGRSMSTWQRNSRHQTTSQVPHRPNANPTIDEFLLWIDLPSKWNFSSFRNTFREANGFWNQFDIEFSPIAEMSVEYIVNEAQPGFFSYVERADNHTNLVQLDEYYRLRNHGSGVPDICAVPPLERGFDAGITSASRRIVVVSNMWDGQNGSLLAHELGHLLGLHHPTTYTSKNLMNSEVHPPINELILNEDQINDARSGATRLSSAI